MGWGFAHEAKSYMLIWSRVRKLLFTRRSFRSLLTPLTYVHVGIKVTKTAPLLPFLQSAMVPRATDSGMFFDITTRAKRLSDGFGILPTRHLLLGQGYQSYPLEV